MIERPSTTITLDTPIKMGENEVKELTLTQPTIGQMRGVKVFDLLQGETGAYIQLLACITTPRINQAQATSIDLVDFLKVIEVVGSWFDKGNANTQTA